MTHDEPIRRIHVVAPPSPLATARDVAIILVCAAILLGTLADLLLPREPAAARAAPAAASVSL